MNKKKHIILFDELPIAYFKMLLCNCTFFNELLLFDVIKKQSFYVDNKSL